MNGKAAFCFTMAALSAVGSVLWFHDALRAMRGDVWPDAMHYYSTNHKTPSNVTLTNAPKTTAE
jgi:hypothetical protein